MAKHKKFQINCVTMVIKEGGIVKIRLRLKDLREDNDLTQKDIAAIIGTSPQYYQKYEKGIYLIPVDRLELLADFYNTSTDYLLGRTPFSRPYPKNRRRK